MCGFCLFYRRQEKDWCNTFSRRWAKKKWVHLKLTSSRAFTAMHAQCHYLLSVISCLTIVGGGWKIICNARIRTLNNSKCERNGVAQCKCKIEFKMCRCGRRWCNKFEFAVVFTPPQKSSAPSPWCSFKSGRALNHPVLTIFVFLFLWWYKIVDDNYFSKY